MRWPPRSGCSGTIHEKSESHTNGGKRKKTYSLVDAAIALRSHGIHEAVVFGFGQYNLDLNLTSFSNCSVPEEFG